MGTAIITPHAAEAQEQLQKTLQDAGMSAQESITIKPGTGSNGLEVHVIHVLNPSDGQSILRLVDVGTIKGDIVMSDVTMVKEVEREAPNNTAKGATRLLQLEPHAEERIVVIPQLEKKMAIEYDLIDAISATDSGIYAMQYMYPHTTLVVMPDRAETVFVNGRHVDLDGGQNIACHGCSMTLEYSQEAPGREFIVGSEEYVTFPVLVTARDEIAELEFNPDKEDISFQVGGGDGDGDGIRFIGVTIPTGLMNSPFTISLDNKSIFYQHSANDTHSTIVMRLESGGVISIKGMMEQGVLEQLRGGWQSQQQKQGQQDNDSQVMIIAVGVGLVLVAAVAIITTKKRFSRR